MLHNIDEDLLPASLQRLREMADEGPAQPLGRSDRQDLLEHLETLKVGPLSEAKHIIVEMEIADGPVAKILGRLQSLIQGGAF